MYYYGARWYDPSLGRFIGYPLGADTLVPNPGDVAAFDRYAYVLNNLLKYRDPTGHCANSSKKNDGEPLGYDNADCWRYADTIANMWDESMLLQQRMPGVSSGISGGTFVFVAAAATSVDGETMTVEGGFGVPPSTISAFWAPESVTDPWFSWR